MTEDHDKLAIGNRQSAIFTPSPLFERVERARRRKHKIRDTHITLAHGSGGRAMHELIEGLFLEYLRNRFLEKLEDQAVFEVSRSNGAAAKLAFTTDSYVVDPIFFPGGDIAAVAVVLFHFEIGERLSRGLELGVALMLLALGFDTLWKIFRRGQLHMHFHRHGGRLHAHPHIHDASQVHQIAHDHEHSGEQPTHHGLAIGPRPLIVGMIHGLAGSGALMLLVLSTISSTLVGMSYILVFGFGSIGGMMLMSLLLSVPFHLTTTRFLRVQWTMRGMAGLFGVSFGVFMIHEIGFVQGLFGI